MKHAASLSETPLTPPSSNLKPLCDVRRRCPLGTDVQWRFAWLWLCSFRVRLGTGDRGPGTGDRGARGREGERARGRGSGTWRSPLTMLRPDRTDSQRRWWQHRDSRRGGKKTLHDRLLGCSVARRRLLARRLRSLTFAPHRPTAPPLLRLQAYCDVQVVNEVVLPLLSMRESVLLCVDSPLALHNP